MLARFSRLRVQLLDPSPRHRALRKPRGSRMVQRTAHGQAGRPRVRSPATASPASQAVRAWSPRLRRLVPRAPRPRRRAPPRTPPPPAPADAPRPAALRLDSQSHALPERGGDGHTASVRASVRTPAHVRGDALLSSTMAGGARRAAPDNVRDAARPGSAPSVSTTVVSAERRSRALRLAASSSSGPTDSQQVASGLSAPGPTLCAASAFALARGRPSSPRPGGRRTLGPAAPARWAARRPGRRCREPLSARPADRWR